MRAVWFKENKMDLADLLVEDSILPALKVLSRKQAIQALSEKAAELAGLNEREVFETLLQRERLGSTGVGSGIAIPHGKLPSVEKIFGIFARLERPIDFDALDEQPVDIIFLLLAPEGAGADHLKALAKIARVLRNGNIIQKIRATSDRDALYSLLISPPDQAAA